MKKIINYSIWVVLLLLSGMVIFNLYQQLYPFKTLKINSATAKTESIKAGDLFIYIVDYCKYTTKPAIVYRTLYSVDESSIVPFPSVQSISIMGCHVVDVPLQTFPTIPPGMYYLLVNANFKINSQKEINITFKTNSFEIR